MLNVESPMNNEIPPIEGTPPSSFARYGELAAGSRSPGRILVYDLVTGVAGSCPGAAGYVLRRFLYRAILGSVGRGVLIGRNVSFRGARRIHLADGVLIEDNCALDARGPEAEIRLGEEVWLSRGTTVRTRGRGIRIGAGTRLGSHCLLGTDSSIEIGEKVLLAAYTYIAAGGNHSFDRRDMPILDQPCVSKGGVRIGDGAWLGAKTTVLDGVTIGEGTVVGAHSLVKTDLPPMTIAHGTPATVRRDRP